MTGAASRTEDAWPGLPTPAQALLLKACLLNGDEAVAAWEAWKASTELDRIDQGSMRLLPLLAEKLRRLGRDDPGLGIYRGVQRRTWARYQFLARGAALAASQLKDAEIPCMALKGIALASRRYASPSLRPMSDFDLIVRRHTALEALSKLLACGWRPHQANAPPRTYADLAAANAYTLLHPTNDDVTLDLHWRMHWLRFSEQADDALWAHATGFEIGGARLLAPCDADMLVHVCVHGARWNGLPPIRWVVDAAMVISRGSVDWSHVQTQTARQGLGRPVADALGYLAAMGVAVPGAVVSAITGLRDRPIDRLIYKAEQRLPEKWGLLTGLAIHHHIAWRELARRQGWIGFWHYLQAARRNRSPIVVAAWVWRRLLRTVRP